MDATTSRRRDESGLALVTVLGFSLVAMLLVSAAVGFAVKTLPQTRNHEDWNAALAAAEAGVDDLRYRLNQNPLYWATFDEDNDALTGWQDVSGATNGAQYHYRIDTSEVARFGHIDVVAVGRVRDQVRTIEVRMRRGGFLDAIYFTDFESSDPYALTNDPVQRSYMDTYCAVHYPHRDRTNSWSQVDANGNPGGGCGTIRFAPGDEIRGPTKTNDAILIRVDNGNPQFLGTVETGWNGVHADGTTSSPPYLRDTGSVGQPHFRDGITSVVGFTLPETTTSLRDQAAETGCRYEGPTYIRFLVDPPRMAVVSPLTDPSTVNAGCGTGTPATGINDIVPLPDGEVIYAGNSTTSQSGHPLGFTTPGDAGVTYSNRYNGWSFGAPQRRVTVSYPPPFDAQAGDIFVHGTVNGRVTVGAENDIVVVHDLLYQDRGPNSFDLIGLISGNNVSVYHPVRQVHDERRTCTSWQEEACGQWSTQNYSGTANRAMHSRNLPPFNLVPGSGLPNSATTWDHARIDAAILALNRSFGVHNFARGAPLGDLSVTGAIAQRWRGPVATSFSSGALASGYLKDYVYDDRLQYLSPPYFLSPVNAPWERRVWAELARPDECASDFDPEDPDGSICVPPLD